METPPLAGAWPLWYSGFMKPKLLSLLALSAILALPACGMRRNPTLADYPDNPELMQAATRFYEFLKLKQLDGLYDQPGIRGFFPNRERYYDFLDTALPPMRERRFERNRILDYRIRAIQGQGEQTQIRVSFLSDDVLPFGKVMTVEQQWILGAEGWYPGKVKAPKAHFWDKMR